MKNKLSLILMSIMIVAFSAKNNAQTPILGSTSNFALFTAVGAFNNTGASFVKGDVGTDVGAFTGFPPGNLVGQIHVADSVSAQAAIDVDIAYGSFAPITCGLVLGTTMGNDQLLTPNVYCTGAATTLNGDLILDGQGDPNAVFIFKIDGAFATSSLAAVVLVHGTTVCNVYWQINGAVYLGNGCDFKGTVVANGALNLDTGATVIGRLLSKAGAINSSTVIVTNPICDLPVINLTTQNVNCNGGSNGAVYSSVVGGNPPYSYLWSNGGTDHNIINVPAGTYTVTMTDNIGLTVSASATVSQPDILVITGIKTNVTNTGGNGAIDITVTGGTPAYTYQWSNGATTQNILNLIAGTYTVTVSDIYGCSANTSFTLLKCRIQIQINKETCPGDSTGTLSVSAFGQGPFNYLWSNGSTTSLISYYVKGTYTVTVTDQGNNGCSAISKGKFVQPLKPIIFLQLRTDITCPACCDGAVINAYAVGGTPPYTYLWSDGGTNPNKTDFCKGKYSLTITDANGCTKTIKKMFGQTFWRIQGGENTFNAVISPNPTSGLVNLDIETEIGGILTINLIDNSGRIVFDKTISNAEDAETISFGFSAYPSGIYALRIQNTYGLQTLKFVKE
nr:DUF3494 domain-containing protein [Bacteroidota bacterium]